MHRSLKIHCVYKTVATFYLSVTNLFHYHKFDPWVVGEKAAEPITAAWDSVSAFVGVTPLDIFKLTSGYQMSLTGSGASPAVFVANKTGALNHFNPKPNKCKVTREVFCGGQMKL